MSDTVTFTRAVLRWAIVIGVLGGVVLGVGEFVFFDIRGIMPEYSLTESLLSWGLLALFAFGWLELRDLHERITSLESAGGVEQ
jgi:hypothetical protein